MADDEPELFALPSIEEVHELTVHEDSDRSRWVVSALRASGQELTVAAAELGGCLERAAGELGGSLERVAAIQAAGRERAAAVHAAAAERVAATRAAAAERVAAVRVAAAERVAAAHVAAAERVAAANIAAAERVAAGYVRAGGAPCQLRPIAWCSAMHCAANATAHAGCCTAATACRCAAARWAATPRAGALGSGQQKWQLWTRRHPPF